MTVMDADKLREEYSSYRIGSSHVVYEQMLDMLGKLPSDTRVLVAYESHRPQVWMARDLPRKGRRFTCLTSGFEVIDLDVDGMVRMGVRSIEVLGGFEMRAGY